MTSYDRPGAASTGVASTEPASTQQVPTGRPIRPLRVLAVGPGPASPISRGGMATVMSAMIDGHDPSVAEFVVVPTYLDHGRLRKTLVGVVGMIRATAIVLGGRVDILHIHLSHGGSVIRKGAPLFAARITGTPSVVHAHSYNFAAWYRRLPRPAARLVRTILRADRWLILGTDLAAEYTEVLDLDPSRVRVLLNPAPESRMAGVQFDDRLPESRLVAVALGRLGERKGTPQIIEGVGRLDADTRSSLAVVLAGDGDVEKSRAAARATAADVIEVRDWISPAERDELLDRASIFLLPSHDEGLPMALLEAMSAGLVPIVSLVGAIGDVIVDGQNGIVVPPGDSAAIADALHRVVDDVALRTRLQDAARATAAELGVGPWRAELIREWQILVTAGAPRHLIRARVRRTT
ncbi:glycosyltransferase family 4 protein [Gordonia soli]|uniref:Putative glycosyltransferase n=1 Tax=Gordonia soli NBRC 108243 TaxID=1223545 RepID=M0QGR4_9ACTN|nr:glycosyltransferase family 4 protein [Gordonia soli]GAC67486.1 putative glycosyltransferase [Gordonia soli NBRC 108243]